MRGINKHVHAIEERMQQLTVECNDKVKEKLQQFNVDCTKKIGILAQ